MVHPTAFRGKMIGLALLIIFGLGVLPYAVAYAIGDSPVGPFSRVGKVLQLDPAVATGAGHHSVIPVPGSDT